jgi:predicted DNA-binding transcriptional regulator AlpA
MSSLTKFKLARQPTAPLPVPTSAPSLSAAPKLPSRPERDDPIAVAMEQAAADVQRLLTPKLVADMLGLTERTLERWRITGEGPRYVKLSRSTVRYLPDDVASFVAANLRDNTAQ